MATTINADTSEGLKLTSDTSGELKLQSAGTDIVSVTVNGIDVTGNFTVEGSGDYDAALVVTSNSSAANWARLDLKNQNVADPFILFQDQNGDCVARSDGEYPLVFQTNGSTQMSITSTGNVGIGTSSPSTKLSLPNNAQFSFQNTSGSMTGGSAGAWIAKGSDNNLYVDNFEGFTAFRGAGYAERMRIDSSGNIGIGKINPTTPLDVTGTVTATTFSGALSGNATTATTATNQSGGTVNATAGAFSGQLTVTNSGTGFSKGINLNAAGNGYLLGTNKDTANSVDANVKITSWHGIGFASSISGQPVPSGQNAGWIDCRTGAMGIRGVLTQNASDRRLKENFEVIPNALEKIASISGYSFDWKMDKCFDLGFKPAKTHEHGVIAQEIKKVIPDAVTIAPFDNERSEDKTKLSRSGENYLTVNIEKLIPLLLQGIKEQQAIITDLKTRIEALENA